MASLVDKLTASGGAESAGFLNDIIAQLWPNINVAGGNMIKQIVEPMLESMLPGPLSTLHFVKLDFGPTPIRLSNVDVHKTDAQGIKLDIDLEWDGRCDFELEGKMVPKVGIEHVKLNGRLSVLLCPLTNIIPLIGAAQIAFINPPTLELDFTDAANLADFSLIDKAVRKVILNIIASMAVLPNRFLVKLDASNDYFKTFQHHLGVIRLTIGTATGLTGPKKSGAKRLLEKLVKDVPDCYCEVNVGAEGEWRTSTQKNKHDPMWDETHDFLVTDHDQCITIDVQDDDVGNDDDIGIAATTVKQILLAGGTQELSLVHKGQPTESKLTVHAKFYNFVDDSNGISAAESQSEGLICGLATVLIASVVGLTGQRDELNPSVKVSWGDKEFVTPGKTYSPGTDIFNPAFDTAFRFPITADKIANPPSFQLTLLNGTKESGSYEVPFASVVGARGMDLAEEFDVGSAFTRATRMLESGDYSDLLIVAKGREFRVHKAVVCPQSPVIAAALRRDCKEANTNTFTIEEFDIDTVKRMIDFMYTETYEIKTEDPRPCVPGEGPFDSWTLDFPGLPPDVKQKTLELTTSWGFTPSIATVTYTLLLHVGISAIANFYDMPKLRELSNKRIEDMFRTSWRKESFPIVATTIWSATGDKELHEILTSIATQNISDLVESPSFCDLDEVSEFALGVLRGCAGRIKPAQPPAFSRSGNRRIGFNFD